MRLKLITFLRITILIIPLPRQDVKTICAMLSTRLHNVKLHLTLWSRAMINITMLIFFHANLQHVWFKYVARWENFQIYNRRVSSPISDFFQMNLVLRFSSARNYIWLTRVLHTTRTTFKPGPHWATGILTHCENINIKSFLAVTKGNYTQREKLAFFLINQRQISDICYMFSLVSSNKSQNDISRIKQNMII